MTTPARTPLPCRHLGGETGETVACKGCGGGVRLKVRACGIYDRCTTDRRVRRMACCRGCPEYAPDTHSLVAPHGTRGRPHAFGGRLTKKPWAWPVSACIPHIETPEPLRVVVETLRSQSIPPYIMVIDTGSSPAVCDQLEAMRSDDLEIHYIRAHAYIHSSAPVAVALDLAHALTRTPYLYHTHADVFIRRRDWLAWLLDRCSAECPVIGYEMSPRRGTDGWRGTVSHTATMLHMPTIRRCGATWSFERWYDTHGLPSHPTIGWPDTETTFGECVRLAGIVPYIVGPDTCPGAGTEGNYRRDTDVNIDHVRSYSSAVVYGGGYMQTVAPWMSAAMSEAMDRVRQWRRGEA